MQYSAIQGNFLRSGKTVKSLVRGFSSLLFLIRTNESINMLFFERRFHRKINSCRASVFSRNGDLGHRGSPERMHHSLFIRRFKDELLSSSEFRSHLELAKESETFLCVKGRGAELVQSRQVYLFGRCSFFFGFTFVTKHF